MTTTPLPRDPFANPPTGLNKFLNCTLGDTTLNFMYDWQGFTSPIPATWEGDQA